MHITVRCLRCTSANHLVLQSEQSRAIWLSHFRLTNSHFLAKTREYEKTCPQCRTAGYLVPCANNSTANPSMLVFGLDNLWCLKPKPQRLRPSRVSSGFPPALLKCVFAEEDRKPGWFAALEDWISELLLQIKPPDVKHECISFHPLNFKTSPLPHCLPDCLIMC